MKYRLLAIIAFAIIGIFAYKEAKFVDLDEEAYKAWASVYIAKYGEVELIEKIASQLDTREYQVVANTALRAAEKIKTPRSTKYDDLPYSKDIYRIIFLNKELDSPNMSTLAMYESRIDFLKSKTEKTKLYSRLAKLYYESGDEVKYQRIVDKAFEASLPLSALISRDSLAFALNVLVELDDVENFYKYAPQVPNSYAKVLAMYSMIKSPNLNKSINAKKKDIEFRKSARYAYLPNGSFDRVGWYAKHFGEDNYDKLLTRFPYLAFQFKPLWSLGKNWNKTNCPMLSYYGYLKGNESIYNYFKPLSISPEQLYDMRADYRNYIRYTSFAFLKMGETQVAVDLIKTIPEVTAKNKVLRQNIMHILANADGLEILKQEGLL